MVIELEVQRFLDLEGLAHGQQIFFFRVWVVARFRRPDGWTPALRALIDTGASFSVLPQTLWTGLSIEDGFTTNLRGLIPLQSATLKARLAQVTCMVSDLKTSAPPLSFWALLAEGNVPLVLGCAGFLDRVTLTLNGPRNLASLEF